jgi:hypothetical protein
MHLLFSLEASRSTHDDVVPSQSYALESGMEPEPMMRSEGNFLNLDDHDDNKSRDTTTEKRDCIDSQLVFLNP